MKWRCRTLRRSPLITSFSLSQFVFLQFDVTSSGGTGSFFFFSISCVYSVILCSVKVLDAGVKERMKMLHKHKIYYVNFV